MKEIVSDKTEYSEGAPVGASLVAQAMDRHNGAGRYRAMQSIKDWDRTRLAYRTVKRAFDIVFSGCVLAVIALPSLVLAAAIRLESEGNPFYSQIPQFINVCLGQMSVVGPRPPLPNEVAEYTEFDLQRLAVKPGITGWWQVTDRNDTGFDGMVRRDLEYIANRGIFTDLKIVILTVIEVITGKGAC